MLIQIKKTHGLDLKYDAERERFHLYDEGGTEIGSAETQAKAELIAKSHSKQKFSRVAIISFGYDHEVIKGELTSYNAEDKSAWVSMEKGSRSWGSGRQKTDLTYGSIHYWEATEANLKLANEIEAMGKEVKRLQAEANKQEEQLEKGINLAYFGIKER